MITGIPLAPVEAVASARTTFCILDSKRFPGSAVAAQSAALYWSSGRGDAAGYDRASSATVSEGARVIENQHPEGLSTSLACGVRVAQAADGWVIALADLPGSSGDYRARCRFFTPRRGGGKSDLDGEMW